VARAVCRTMQIYKMYNTTLLKILPASCSSNVRWPLRFGCAMALPSRTQSLKAAIVFDRDVTVKASLKNALNLQNLIKTVKFLVSTLFFSRTMCLGFTITASWSKMPLMTRKLSFISEVKFVYLLFLRNFYFVNHLNNTKSQQMLLTA
jgi:hypothetical protein